MQERFSSSVIFLSWLCCVPSCCTVGEYQCDTVTGTQADMLSHCDEKHSEMMWRECSSCPQRDGKLALAFVYFFIAMWEFPFVYFCMLFCRCACDCVHLLPGIQTHIILYCVAFVLSSVFHVEKLSEHWSLPTFWPVNWPECSLFTNVSKILVRMSRHFCGWFKIYWGYIKGDVIHYFYSWPHLLLARAQFSFLCRSVES